MVAADLKHEVLLAGGGEVSGLADMLHQFLSQILDEYPAKSRLARRISGRMLFRAAEDEAICVKLSFDAGTIEIRDHAGARGGMPSLTADFLTTAHLTTGEESPFALVSRRKMRVRCAPWHAPFLVRVLRLMRIPPRPEIARARRLRWALLVVATAAAAGVAWWLLAR